MSSGGESADTGARRSWLPWLAGLFVTALVLVTAGVWAVKHFDLFFESRPDFIESRELHEAARKGPLTDAQFGRAAELLGTAQPAAQMFLISTLNLEGEKTPGRREPAIRALEGLPESAAENVRQAAAATAARLKAPPKGP